MQTRWGSGISLSQFLPVEGVLELTWRLDVICRNVPFPFQAWYVFLQLVPDARYSQLTHLSFHQGVWTLGNLGRAGYGASNGPFLSLSLSLDRLDSDLNGMSQNSDGVWPYSYDS